MNIQPKTVIFVEYKSTKMLKQKVFADNLTSLADARYFAANGADWLSFLVTPNHPNSMSQADILEIKGWLSGPSIVGRFIHPSSVEIQDTINKAGLDAVLVDANTPLSVLQQGFSVPVFKEVLLSEKSDWVKEVEWSAPFADGIVLKSDQPINKKNKQLLKELCQTYDIVLDATLAGEWQIDTFRLVEPFTPKALMVEATGTEEEIGKKTFEQMDSFFDELSDED